VYIPEHKSEQVTDSCTYTLTKDQGEEAVNWIVLELLKQQHLKKGRV
jgi:hypothetical protein